MMADTKGRAAFDFSMVASCRVEAAFAEYLAARRSVYAAERRWPDAPFWRRRSGVAVPRGGLGA